MGKLFVYGTLRVGLDNEYSRRLRQEAKHLGQARISGRLYQVAHYPGLALAESADDYVMGDLFDGVSAETFKMLDEYEGDEYVREWREILLNGQTVRAFVYRYILPTAGLTWIRSGDWNHPDRIPD